MSHLLEVKDLVTVFNAGSKEIKAVSNASFTLNTNETLGIVGESGSGKSAMVKSLLRLLPLKTAQIKKGHAFYKGEDLLVKSEKEMRKIRGRKMGMIFQDPMSCLNPTMRVGEQIIEGYRWHYKSASKKQAYTQAIDYLKRFGLREPELCFKQYPHQLSGGMCQRMMIASAMMISPDILIADEPTTALDVTIQIEILRLLKSVQEESGMGIILISHDLSVIANFCTDLVVMYAGEIVESGPVKSIFANPKHPYTRSLLNAIPSLDQTHGTQLGCIPGQPPDLTLKTFGCPFAPRCPSHFNRCDTLTPKLIEVSQNQKVRCLLYEPLTN